MAIRFELTTEENTLTCAVCGTAIADIRHAFTETHAGQMLVFCRPECVKEFLEDPERYVKSTKP